MTIAVPIVVNAPATAGTNTFSVTRDLVIRQAMLNIGRLDPDESPSSQEISDISRVLNMVVKQWQGKADGGPGLKVFTRRHGHLFLQLTPKYIVGPGATGWAEAFANTTTSASALAAQNQIVLASTSGVINGYVLGVLLVTGSFQWTTITGVSGSMITLAVNLTAAVASGAQVFAYATVANQPIVIETALLRDSFGNDVPLRILNVQDYDNLPSKANPTNISDPSAIYYEFQLTNSILKTDVYGASDLTKYIRLTYLEAIQDLNNPNDVPEYPQEYFLALCWELSKQIRPMFPQAVWTQDMEMTYREAVGIAKRKDPEISTLYFVPGDD